MSHNFSNLTEDELSRAIYDVTRDLLVAGAYHADWTMEIRVNALEGVFHLMKNGRTVFSTSSEVAIREEFNSELESLR